MEGTIFHSGHVELVNPEETFVISRDWPNPHDEEDSDDHQTDHSDYEMNNGYTSEALDSMAIMEDYEEQGQQPNDDWETMPEYRSYDNEPDTVVRHFHPYTADGKQTKVEEPSFLKLMISNARDRQERLAKIARIQIDCMREREALEVSKALHQLTIENSDEAFGSNSMELEEESPVKTEGRGSKTSDDETPGKRTLSGPDRRGSNKRWNNSDQHPVKAGTFEHRHTSQANKWKELLSARTPKRTRTRRQLKEEPNNTLEQDKRTLRELRENLNSLMFDVSSIQLETHNSVASSGKVTPLVTN
ncbi:hypothetical protein P7C70_g9287, partial [Phenoliferia sp. Uapishka_3]